MKNNLLLIMFLIQQFIFSEIMIGQNNRVAKSAEEICPIKIGTMIPSANIQSIDGKEIDIRKVIKDKKSILIFYRGGWCPYCNMHFSELQNVEAELLKSGYKIIAISMDTPKNLKTTFDKYNMKYELYSDSKANAVKEFGIAFKVEDDYINKLKSYNMDLEASSGENHHILPVPSVFVINENGKIIFEYINPNYKERISGKLLLDVVKNYK